jgi:hypothetical protein
MTFYTGDWRALAHFTSTRGASNAKKNKNFVGDLYCSADSLDEKALANP